MVVQHFSLVTSIYIYCTQQRSNIKKNNVAVKKPRLRGLGREITFSLIQYTAKSSEESRCCIELEGPYIYIHFLGLQRYFKFLRNVYEDTCLKYIQVSRQIGSFIELKGQTLNTETHLNFKKGILHFIHKLLLMREKRAIWLCSNFAHFF